MRALHLPWPARSPRTLAALVMLCHFIAAFAALGMPPFFALILQKSLHADAPMLAGWLYVVPTVFTALTGSWWGKLADRYGRRRLLLRAQLGLAASFLLAGYADGVELFFLALCLQGILGGTFAASNAYLASITHGAALAGGLNALQWSARAALLLGPLLVGYSITALESPIMLYRYLALLPLLAFGLTWLLAPVATADHVQVDEPVNDQANALPHDHAPATAQGTATAQGMVQGTATAQGGASARATASPQASASVQTTASATADSAVPAASTAPPPYGKQSAQRHAIDNLFLLNFVFALALVLGFPYFVPHALPHLEQLAITLPIWQVPLSPTLLAGLLFGLPHGVYLLLVWPLGRAFGQYPPWLMLAAALGTLGLCQLAHLTPEYLWLLLLARLVMGVALTFAYLALHALLARLVVPGSAGQHFGRFDASGKWGGVLAGLGAGLVVGPGNFAAPFGLAALLLLLGAIRALLLHRDLIDSTQGTAHEAPI